MTQDLASRIGSLDRLEEPARQVQGLTRRLFEAAGPAVRNALHGTWLGHPLHIVLTDLPLGAWLSTGFLDAMGLDAGADACLGLGLACVIPTALSGLLDWSSLNGNPRRVGFVHAGLNVLASGLFATSLVLRKQGQRDAGRTLSYLGLGLGVFSAWLGGHLVYRDRIGVNHSREGELPEDFVDVLAEPDLKEGEPVRVTVQGTPILLVKRGSRLHAMAERCSHLGGPLAEGQLEGDSIRCPWHGSRFALEDGRVLEGPAVHPQACLEARVMQGRIHVRLRRPEKLEQPAAQPLTQGRETTSASTSRSA